MSRTQSRVDRAKEGKKQRKVKIVMGKGTAKFLRYSWFPGLALILFSIGLYIGVYFITRDTGAFFSGDLWSKFFKALRNF